MTSNSKAICFTLWFPQHANPRYADLFPRLSSVVDFCKVTLSRQRVIRGVQFRVWNLFSRRLIYPAAIKYLARKYETLFTVSYDQIAAWPKEQSVVVDIDDPVFSHAEVNALNLPQVKAIIVTTEKAKQIFHELGVSRPIHVIPQGVPVGEADLQKAREIRERFKSSGDVVVGYHAPSLTMSADGSKRRRNDQDDLDYLFAALEQARKEDPRIRLWLFGAPSAGLRNHVLQGRESWVKLFGYVPFSEMLNYLVNVDIGVYPRTWSPPPGRFSVKIAQFMACGIPVVSTHLDESFVLLDARCGVVCKSQEDFTEAVVALSRSAERRAELGNAGRSYAQEKLDWSVLIPAYRNILAGVNHDG
jgi:glycosyltransferase involved in cell wall biosynthesis